MPEASRHAKPRTRKNPAVRFGAPIAAAVAVAGVATAVVVLHGGFSASPASPASHHTAAVASTGSSLSDEQLATAVHHDVAAAETRVIQRSRAKAAARRRHLAALAAAAAALRAQQAAAHPSPSATTSRSTSTSPSPAPTLSSGGGGDAAHSSLGNCIRNAEEGGSYAWGPGNGGGAYQFQLGTWEHYGGAASEYGAAGAAYQDQIFDNGIAAGGASNWTNYDGC